MAEKRGLIVKLEYDFNTAGVLEIYLNQKWFRVTSKDFRSFDGKRRITEPQYTERYNPYTPMKTYDYFGPVYMLGTNNKVPYKGTGTLVESDSSKYFQNIYNQHQSGSVIRQ